MGSLPSYISSVGTSGYGSSIPVPSSSDSTWDSPAYNDTTNAGNLPSNAVEMSLGGIEFTNFQAPETFDWGTEVLTIKHQYVDNLGNAVTKNQMMGAFPLPISFTGKLYYANAVNDALRLETLCKGQEGVTFVFGQLSWQVTVKRIKFTTHHQYDIDFTVELEPYLENNGGPSAGTAVVPFDVNASALANNVQDGLSWMTSYDVSLPANVANDTNNALTGVNSSFPLQSQTPTTLSNIQGLITQAQSSVSKYLTPLMNLTDFTSLNVVPGGLKCLSNLTLLGSNISTLLGTNGVSQQTIKQFTGNLFNVAATYFPTKDPADIANKLAAANGLADLFVHSPTDINIPPMLY